MELHGFTSCLYLLHDRLHPAYIDYMSHYILPLLITCSIICSRMHYIVHRCQSMGSWSDHRQRRSDRCVARLARLARAINSPSSVTPGAVRFNLQDNIPACSDRTCSKQMRWLPARGPYTIEVKQCRWSLMVVGTSGAWNIMWSCHIQRFNQIELLEAKVWNQPVEASITKHSEAYIMKTPQDGHHNCRMMLYIHHE